MTAARVSLTNVENEALRTLALKTGKTEEQLIHEAIRRLLKETSEVDRLELLRQARGIWKDREDLPDVRELRAEYDREQGIQ